MGVAVDQSAIGARVFVPGRAVEAINLMRRVVDLHKRSAALKGVRITVEGAKLRIEGTDLQTIIRYETEIEALLDARDFSVTVQLNALYDIVWRSMSGFGFEVTATGASVHPARAKTATLIPYVVGHDFPGFDVGGDVREAGISMADLVAAVDFATKFRAEEGAALAGVSLEISENGDLIAIGTDGYRLGGARARVDQMDAGAAVVAALPASAVTLFAGVSEKANIEGDHARVRLSSTSGEISWGEYQMVFRSGSRLAQWRDVVTGDWSVAVRGLRELPTGRSTMALQAPGRGGTLHVATEAVESAAAAFGDSVSVLVGGAGGSVALVPIGGCADPETASRFALVTST